MRTTARHGNRSRLHRRFWIVTVSGVLALVGSVIANPAQAAVRAGAGCASAVSSWPSSIGKFHGILRPLDRPGPGCLSPAVRAEPPYAEGAAPPLLYNGGPVMDTASTGPVIVTPIFWAPPGYSFTSSYKTVIDGYIHDIAAASGSSDNVFSSLQQYYGSNGTITYRFTAGAPIDASDAFPASGCTVDTGSIYSDGSSYALCLDDDQVQAEVQTVVAAHSLPLGLGHIYMLFLPKHVESCFSPAGASNQQCTLNATPTAAFCAYHSAFFDANSSPYVYADMPFPIYASATQYSCTEEGFAGGIQSPNGDPDADVEVSPLSHELSEAVTDPYGDAWLDSANNENGDDCAYIYGPLSGSPGAYYNQTINGNHYLTQEEFSNADFVPNVSGCVQQYGASAVAAPPAVSGMSPTTGSTAGGGTVTVTGTGLTDATAVAFGGTVAAGFSVLDDSHLSVTVPPHPAGAVDVTVSTPAGTSALVSADRYTYLSRPSVTKLTPSSGSRRGGTLVTITGTGFVPNGTAVAFGRSLGQVIAVLSPTQLVVRTRRHAMGLAYVAVGTAGGISPLTSRGDIYRFL